eukprot:3895817-Amphidinium_carterae.2
MDGFPTVDAKLVSAINRIAKGEVLRLLNIRIAADTRCGIFTSGKCMLRVVLSYYRTCSEHQSLYSISDILQVRLASTPQGLRSFWTNWRWIEEGLAADVGEQVKTSPLYEQVKDYPPLAAELLPYKLADARDPCRSYSYLTKIVARHAERELQESTRKQVVAGIRDLAGGQDRAFTVTPEENHDAKDEQIGEAHPAQTLGGSSKVCWLWQDAGTCKYGENCKFLHPPEAQGRNKGQKGRRDFSRGRRSQTPDARQRQSSANSNGSGASAAKCLGWAKIGKCRFGDKCKFAHESTSDENIGAERSLACVDGSIALPCLSESEGNGVHDGKRDECMTWHSSQFACSAGHTEREWVADTGSGNDLLGRNFVSNDELDSACTLPRQKKLRTANGKVDVFSKVTCEVESLNVHVEPLLLDECPPVLSIGKRVEEGFSFHWTPEKCMLVCPNGCETLLEVRGRVPLLIERDYAMPAELDIDAAQEISNGPTAASSEGPTAAPSEDPVDQTAQEDGEEDMEEGGGVNRKAFLRKGRTIAFSQSRVHRLLHYPKNENCECCRKSCMLARQARRTVDADDHCVVAEKFGDLVHFDHVHVRREMIGMGGEKYALIIVDDFTGFCAAYPTCERSAGGIVNAMRHFIGRDASWGEISIRSDSAPECISACRELKVKHYPSTPYRHTSNAKAERWVRMCEDVVRSMLYQIGLGHPFWSQALPVACMMLNAIVPYRDNMTPWIARRGTGTFPWKVSAFGSRIHALIHGKKGFDSHGKFQIRGSECIFLGWEWAPGYVHCDYKVVPVAQIRAMDSPGGLHVLRTTDIETEDSDEFSFPFFSNEGEGPNQEDAMFHHGDMSVREETQPREQDEEHDERDHFGVLTSKQKETGWRVDKFGDRLVKTPPGFGRPSWLEPESWRALPLSVRRSLMQDERGHDDEAIIDDAARTTGEPASASSRSLIAMNERHVWFEGDEKHELGTKNSICMETDVQELAQWAAECVERRVLVEACCNVDSVLGERARCETWVVRITETCNMSSTECQSRVQEILQSCARVFLWISVPCTTGCAWHRTNPGIHEQPRFREKVAAHAKIARGALKCVKWAVQLDQRFAWEWPAHNDLWKSEVGELVQSLDGSASVQVHGCDFGMADGDGQRNAKAVEDCYK